MNNFGQLLKTEVNSAMITVSNHDKDNSFFESKVYEIENALKERCYEFIGISKHVPFPCGVSDYSLAFVYKCKGEVYWCHIPETYWFTLLKQCYGYDEADKIIESILG